MLAAVLATFVAALALGGGSGQSVAKALGPGAASAADTAGRCVPARLNVSAVLPGTPVSVSPLPDSFDASPRTQISLLGVSVGALSGVRVSGSSSGSHAGRLRGYSQGDGASFVPAKPFVPGETVSVRGSVRVGAQVQQLAYHFTVAYQDALPHVKVVHAIRDPNEKQHFRSRPDLEPPAVVVSARSPQTAGGDVFTAPYGGPGASGPMIFDEAGNLIWFDPLAAGTEATDLKVQQLGGRQVLSWWQGYIPPQGFGQGEEIIADTSYRPIVRVHAGNGYAVDLHSFRIYPNGTALLTVFNPLDCSLTSVGGPPSGGVTDTAFQELDLQTGLVRREWHSLDHVALGDSYSPVSGSSRTWPFDYFHINSVNQLGGTTLISGRNTWALYELDSATGQVLTRIGGKHSDVQLAPGAATAFQHDATFQPDGTISVFDNGATPKVHPQSRGLVVTLDPDKKSETVREQYEHPTPPLSSASQGNIQLLENGDAFIGWGSEPYFSEFGAGGQLLFDAHLHGSYQSYRAYRFPWTGAPASAPAIAASPPASGRSVRRPVTVYASWNGDTRTASWRVLGGSSPRRLAQVASAAKAGFETAIATPAPEAYVAVQALDGSGAVLGTSKTIRG